MKNFEKWESFIMKSPAKCNVFAVIKGIPCTCEAVTICDLCDFKKEGFHILRSCAAHRIAWLYRDYVEKPKLTKNEKKFVDLMGTDMYLTRDKSGKLYLSIGEPSKAEIQWFGGNSCLNMKFFDNLEFHFIKWEDEKPWSIEELLKLEVQDN